MRFPQRDWRGIRKRDMVEKERRGDDEAFEVGPLEALRSEVVKIESSGT